MDARSKHSVAFHYATSSSSSVPRSMDRVVPGICIKRPVVFFVFSPGNCHLVFHESWAIARCNQAVCKIHAENVRNFNYQPSYVLGLCASCSCIAHSGRLMISFEESIYVWPMRLWLKVKPERESM